MEQIPEGMLTLPAIPFSIINSIAAFGEELGWHGYLQDKFVCSYGRTLGIRLLGPLWGSWHFPLILPVGYNYPDSLILGAFLLFPATAVLASFFRPGS
ncbi:CPBP family glutamic-type intramembrane protease [Rhodohalobacter sp. 8-1]|uniref:CPBP family glutamic-type intramembrane protease n=1 Tax=Rhodohalobacter sp. 8-1 TaxID=3131972 RepID=UPI00403F6742